MNSTERHERRYMRRKARRDEKRRQQVCCYDCFDQVFTFNHLYRSYIKARRGVRWKASVQKYVGNAVEYVWIAFDRLKRRAYVSKGFFEFDLYERGKKRHIRSVLMEERVVQKCLCDYSLVPILRRTFVYDNGASMKGKGYSFAVNRFVRHLLRHTRKYGNKGYILLFDFHSFFDSMPHKVLFEAIDRAYTDPDIKSLVHHLVDMFGPVGIGLGSQVSQVLALAAGNGLDHFIKEHLRIKGAGRYNDDGYLIHQSREYLEWCLEEIKAYCDRVGFTLNLDKTRIVPLSNNFMWLKINVFVTDTGRIVRRAWRKSVTRMRRKLRRMRKLMDKPGTRITLHDIWQSYQSWRSHLSGLRAWHTLLNTERLLIKLYGKEVIGA